ncbi:hypothetical protein MJO28_007074 [Puccinia striiformis f. sp. tritici]|uniref:Uncharacterized protein n=2 Tax=Puccinia striiformis f. sp. tritici TaxID=168172 RepID=A0A0L0VRW6_9BASI|nr:hypothetical protein MJO28_007074 [Puccinia striiformis f. sp. tritici]KAI7955629.1 hypothetical protein MJO29_007028 [Puccinia striiformis f. sp. tritici]KAI9622732.1 hypothetical protein H4Q26_015014 [Puccinia striiformis f. sp. tritici PST-130]KNF02011.1 hypothetical protein PSTG_04832 [Puccinia striiformis f. sp. tritici PST-78]
MARDANARWPTSLDVCDSAETLAVSKDRYRSCPVIGNTTPHTNLSEGFHLVFLASQAPKAHEACASEVAFRGSSFGLAAEAPLEISFDVLIDGKEMLISLDFGALCYTVPSGLAQAASRAGGGKSDA